MSVEKESNSRVDLVVICNPNNPTGKLIDEDLLLEILEKCCRTGTKAAIRRMLYGFLWMAIKHIRYVRN